VVREPAAVEVLDDGLVPPVAVVVDDVASVAVGQQLRIEARVVRPGAGIRADTDRRLVGGQADSRRTRLTGRVTDRVGSPATSLTP
jgi:hypothetical protein